MKKWIAILTLTCCAYTGLATAADLLDPIQPKLDKKNVILSIGDLVILRSHDANNSNVNKATAYLEAYNKYTGQRVWTVKDVGVIVSYDVIDPYTIVYRNMGRLTAVSLQSGQILWQQNTMGAYSVFQGE